MKSLAKNDKGKVSTGKKKFHCNDCDFKSDQKSSFTYHLLSTHPEKKVKCHICDKTVSRNYLERHIKFTHEISSQVSCFECRKEFKSEAYLKEHLIRIHNFDEHQILRMKKTKHNDCMEQNKLMK